MVKNINVLKPLELNEPILIGAKKLNAKIALVIIDGLIRCFFFIDQTRNLLQKVTNGNVS
jgi:hypothetical protein